MKQRGWAGVLAAALFFSSCAVENGLGGSISEVFPLEVSRVEVYRNDEALQVTYYRNRGVFLDVVVRLAVALKDVDLKPGNKVVLEGEYAPFHPRASVTHAPGGEPVRSLPPVQKGELTLSGGGPVGTVTTGSFSMLFAAEGGDLGGGRTLNGSFNAVALDAGFGPLP